MKRSFMKHLPPRPPAFQPASPMAAVFHYPPSAGLNTLPNVRQNSIELTLVYLQAYIYAILGSVKKLHAVGPEPVRAFLVGIQTGGQDAGDLEELQGLADTLGLAAAGTEMVTIRESGAKYGMGSGKAAEIAEKASASDAECIIFDREISPTQQRNWETLSGLSAIDRQELIIRIFAGRARTKEAALQAELARLMYSLPRLSHKYIDLSRQRGGRYGTKGSGETRLETDKRLVRGQINGLKRELEEVRLHRQVQRRQRERQRIPVAALVGYTNAGKSLLHRALTGSDVFVEDKLFATLDTSSRRMDTRQNGAACIITDTVGFIRKLPHNLVDAFRSTLEEAAKAQLLVHVIDASCPAAEERFSTVIEVLEELGAGKIPRITVFNKADIDEEAARRHVRHYQGSIAVSAKTGENIGALWELITKSLKPRTVMPIMESTPVNKPRDLGGKA